MKCGQDTHVTFVTQNLREKFSDDFDVDGQLESIMSGGSSGIEIIVEFFRQIFMTKSLVFDGFKLTWSKLNFSIAGQNAISESLKFSKKITKSSLALNGPAWGRRFFREKPCSDRSPSRYSTKKLSDRAHGGRLWTPPPPAESTPGWVREGQKHAGNYSF